MKMHIRVSLPLQILIGLLLGIAAGFFFGDYTRFLAPVGDAFVMLLKMSVLPYITLALIHGIGGLTAQGAKRLVKYGLIFMVLIWVVTITTIYIYSLAYPPREVAALYPPAAPSPDQPHSILELFIPSNPFYALSNNIVPAIVLFSIFFGIALMFIAEKEPLLKLMETALGALTRIITAIIRISPYGIFALIASNAGTMTFHEFEKLEAYLIIFLAVTLFLTFWALPICISSFTPLKYRQVVRELRTPLILAFATGNILVTLPYIMHGISGLVSGDEDTPQMREAKSMGQTLTPIAYNLPLVGNLMALSVILFLAYFYAITFTPLQQVQLVITSIFTLVGPVAAGYNAVGFMLDAMRMPSDGLAIFVETSAVTRNMQGLAGSMGIATFTLLTTFAFTHRLRFRVSKLLLNGLLTLVILGVTAYGVDLITPSIRVEDPPYPHLQIDSPVVSRVILPGEEIPPKAPAEGNQLERILERGELRVGYFPDALPFSYFNEKGELVGFDIWMAYQLAEDLGVSLTFIPFIYNGIPGDLQEDRYDIAMADIDVTAERLERVRFSDPVLTADVALIVPDFKRDQFKDLATLQEDSSLRIGVLQDSVWEELAHIYFPQAIIVPVPGFGAGLDALDIDAYLINDLTAIPTVVADPRYTVVIPAPMIEKRIRAYPVAGDAERWEEYVNYWLRLQEVNDKIAQGKKKWIEGQKAEEPKRWSVIRNVLHWVD